MFNLQIPLFETATVTDFGNCSFLPSFLPSFIPSFLHSFISRKKNIQKQKLCVLLKFLKKDFAMLHFCYLLRGEHLE